MQEQMKRKMESRLMINQDPTVPIAYKSIKELQNKSIDFIEPIHKAIALRHGVNYRNRQTIAKEEDPYQFRLDDKSIIFSSH